jgi:N-methylhydantoinase A
MIDLRYEGQEYSLTIAIVPGRISAKKLGERFHEAYQQTYGHASHSSPVEIVRLRVAAIGRLPRLPRERSAARVHYEESVRAVFFDSRPLATRVLARENLGVDERVAGPLIVEEPTATTIVPPSWTCSASPEGHLVIRRAGR